MILRASGLFALSALAGVNNYGDTFPRQGLAASILVGGVPPAFSLDNFPTLSMRLSLSGIRSSVS